jgi:glycosyltransferase involved in cell wall biosynthesis
MASRAPLVTVIVPTIGRPQYIADTVRSVLQQDHADIDLLISDNAPSKPTRDVLAAAGISDGRIRIVARPQRLDFSTHMNLCIAEARGEFVMILSDDDQLSRGYVAEMVGFVAADAGVSVCLGRQNRITENDKGLVDSSGCLQPPFIMEGVDFLTQTMSGRLDVGLLTYISLFARKADLTSMGAFKLYPDGSHADNFILLNLALRGRVAVGCSLMLYRVYLASSGLSTPFAALLAATRDYTVDFCAAVRASAAVSASARRELTRLIKRNNTLLLVSRIKRTYRSRLSTSSLLICMGQTLKFALTPVRRL